LSAVRLRLLAGISIAAVALAAAAAFRVEVMRRDPSRPLAVPPPGRPWSHVDTLARGEVLASLFARAGLGAPDAAQAIRAAAGLDDRRIPAGMEVRFSGDSVGPDMRAHEILLTLSLDRAIRLVRANDTWTARDERTPWTTDTVVVHGVVRSNLYDALDAGAADLLPKGARAELAWTLADLYEYRIDMSRELQGGDAVRVAFERLRSPSGATRIGTIVAAGIERGGAEIQAIRYEPRGAGRSEYYDAAGRSLRAAFLRAPLEFRRISSVFGLRLHPILGEWKNHTGTDYAAAAGTPVRAIGDGVVVFAGERGGYGNSIDVRHANGFVSRYGHMRGFARGIRAGSRVAMGSTIGYVGMTGLATAPHLHFEIRVGGVARDPRSALKANAGTPLPTGEAARFEQARRLANTVLEHPAGLLVTTTGSR
jgi:murein DD-endopeptidase MepM/ murein hydrolase activator NlpD